MIPNVRHRLVIVDVGENDFGNYSCLAENELGRTRGYIELSGNYEYSLNLYSQHFFLCTLPQPCTQSLKQFDPLQLVIKGG